MRSQYGRIRCLTVPHVRTAIATKEIQWTRIFIMRFQTRSEISDPMPLNEWSHIWEKPVEVINIYTILPPSIVLCPVGVPTYIMVMHAIVAFLGELNAYWRDSHKY